MRPVTRQLHRRRKCTCVCGGRFHGDKGASERTWEEINQARGEIALDGDQQVQMRFGA